MSLAKTVLTSAAMAVLVSCNWGEFDDLKKDTWAALLERDSSGTSGDLGIDIVAIPLPASQNGMRFVISSGSTAGLSEATFDETGDVTSFSGVDGDSSGTGQIRPISTTLSTAYSLAAYDGTNFIAGVPDKKVVASYATGGTTGPTALTTILTGTIDKTGEAVAVGDLGLGSAKPDIVTNSTAAVILIPGGTGTPVACQIRAPDKNGNAPVIPLENLKIARMGGGAGPAHIVVSGRDASTTPRIFILEAAQVQANNGANCPTTGFAVDVPVAPVSVQIADIDKNGTNDIVAGFYLGPSGGVGRVIVYLNPTPGGGAPTAMEIPFMAADNSSGLRGTRIRVANIDDDASDEIIVGDGTATVVDGEGGQVQLYRWGTTGCSAARGPACLVRSLYDAGGKDFFGRALAIGQFKSGSQVRNVLAVAMKDNVAVYFRVSTTQTDPRP